MHYDNDEHNLWTKEQVLMLIEEKHVKSYPNRTLFLDPKLVGKDDAEVIVQHKCPNRNCNRKIRLQKLLNSCVGETRALLGPNGKPSQAWLCFDCKQPIEPRVRVKVGLKAKNGEHEFQLLYASTLRR